LLTLNADLCVREANNAFYETFSVPADETIGRAVYDLGDGQWDFPELRSLLEEVLPGDTEFANLLVERDFPRIGHRIMELSARRVREEHGRPSILLAVNDMTNVTTRARLSAILNNVSIAFSSALEFDEVLGGVLEESSTALRARSAAVLVQENRDWVLKSAFGLPRTRVKQVVDEQGLPIGVVSPQTGAPVLLAGDEAARFISVLGLDQEVGSVLVVPMLHREQTAGFLSLHFQSAAESVSEAEIDFVRRLGTLLGLAFENSKLYATQKEIADTLQAALLTAPRRIPGVEFGHLYRSASTSAAVGGDFFDVFELDGDRAGVLVGDVSGKGVEAATLTALVKNTIRTLSYEHTSPAVVMDKANAVILKATPSSLFATITFCVIDIASGRLTYCSAGHTRSIVKKAAGGVEFLETGSPLAGAFEAVDFQDGETVLEKDDVLILYTDGVTEARCDGELFGEERLADFVTRMAPTPPKKVPKAVFDEVLRYTGGGLSDDVAIVAIARSNKG
jgi:serine phosphatase RsbU (regulator of sigma subunit)